ncbi:MAG: hypothetical protein KC420_14140 [Myxococcales bacterium]|nr:hypothetical protein [Myxococcales bacterium]
MGVLVGVLGLLAVVGGAGCDRDGGGPATPIPVQRDTPPATAGADVTQATAVDPRPIQAAQEAQEPSDTPTPPRSEVVLIVLGSFPDELLDPIEETLREVLPVEVRRGGTRPLPKEAYYAPRRRYRADLLLEHLDRAAAEEAPGARYLGLTDVDISTTKGKHKDWGIFGLAYVPGRAAVISSFRLKRGVRSPEHFAFRVANTAVHEVGHSLGLDHCEEPGCPMRDAEGSIATTDSSNKALGPECAEQLSYGDPLSFAQVEAPR